MDQLPLIFGKKDLCRVLECFMPCGQPNYKRLRRFFLTDEVLSRSGITLEVYQKTRLFTFEQCRAIIHTLQLEDQWQG